MGLFMAVELASYQPTVEGIGIAAFTGRPRVRETKAEQAIAAASTAISAPNLVACQRVLLGVWSLFPRP
jgi:hypothetical protein